MTGICQIHLGLRHRSCPDCTACASPSKGLMRDRTFRLIRFRWNKDRRTLLRGLPVTRQVARCARSSRSSHFSARANSRPLSLDVPARRARSTDSAAFRLVILNFTGLREGTVLNASHSHRVKLSSGLSIILLAENFARCWIHEMEPLARASLDTSSAVKPWTVWPVFGQR